MEIMKRLAAKDNDAYRTAPVTIGFLGDSVTQGCFEVVMTADGRIDTAYDPENCYPEMVRKILRVLCPHAQLNIIPAGISGDSAPGGLERLERDLLPFKPDLTVVAFGLNDCGGGMEGLPRYTDALRRIFTRLQDAGSEVIFLTTNSMCTWVSPFLIGDTVRNAAQSFVQRMEDGTLDAYMDAARKTAEECGVPVCDCYRQWKALAAAGVNTTELLANKLNHPTRDMHWFFAYELVRQMIGG